METTLYAERPGRVAEVLAVVGHQVKTGELLDPSSRARERPRAAARAASRGGIPSSEGGCRP